MTAAKNGKASCDGCGTRGAKLFIVRDQKELEGCLLMPGLKRICEGCREEIFLELEALKRQAARMGGGRRSRTSKRSK